MTDGIIQKVFKAYKEYKLRDGILEVIEQELIAEIKKNVEYDSDTCFSFIWMDDLIGDNKE